MKSRRMRAYPPSSLMTVTLREKLFCDQIFREEIKCLLVKESQINSGS